MQMPLCVCPDASLLRSAAIKECSAEELQAAFLVAKHPSTRQPPDRFDDDPLFFDVMSDSTGSTRASTADSDSMADPDERLRCKQRRMSKAELKQAQKAFQKKLKACTDDTVARLWAAFPMFTESDVQQALKENNDHEGEAHMQLFNLAQTQPGQPPPRRSMSIVR